VDRRESKRRVKICFLFALITGFTLHPVEPVKVVHNTLGEINSVKGKMRLTLLRTWGGDEADDENQFFRYPMDIVIGKDRSGVR
jgi:hypothetical protein